MPCAYKLLYNNNIKKLCHRLVKIYLLSGISDSFSLQLKKTLMSTLITSCSTCSENDRQIEYTENSQTMKFIVLLASYFQTVLPRWVHMNVCMIYMSVCLCLCLCVCVYGIPRITTDMTIHSSVMAYMFLANFQRIHFNFPGQFTGLCVCVCMF